MSSFNIENKKDCSKDNNKLNSNAIQKPLTVKPSIKLFAIKIIHALITNRNKPKVITVIGKVKMIKIGLTIMFSNPRTIATITAEVNPSTATPGKNFANITTATAVNNMRMIKLMKFCF